MYPYMCEVCGRTPNKAFPLEMSWDNFVIHQKGLICNSRVAKGDTS